MLRQIAIGALRATQFALEVAAEIEREPYSCLDEETRIESHLRDGKYVVYTKRCGYNPRTGREDGYVPVFIGAYDTREEAEANSCNGIYDIA